MEEHYVLVFEHLDSDPMLDTKVLINGTYLCTISGSEAESFARDFDNVISKYRI